MFNVTKNWAIYTLFLYKQHQAEIGQKKQAKAKQHPETELLLFEIIYFFHSSYHPKPI